MKKKYIYFLVAALFSVSLIVASCSDKKKDKDFRHGPIEEVSFEESMGKGTDEYQIIFSNPDDVVRFNNLKENYEKNLPSKLVESQQPKIPKILHQIWLGPKTPPSYFATFRDKWKSVHPDWEYRLWTDVDVEELGLELKDLIDQTPNYAEKSDILRSELLDRFGGVYLDVDMECYHSLEELNHKYDMYVGIEYPHKIDTTNNRVWLGISIMASRPNHPVLKRWKELIRAGWDEVNRKYSSPVSRVINHTYFPFSIAFFEKYKEQNLNNMAFPATYFYPLSAASAAKRRSGIRAIREKLYDFLESVHLKNPRPFARVYPESIAVHYWGNTWIATPQEKMNELQNQIDLIRREHYRLQQKVLKIDKEMNHKKQDELS